LAQRFAEQSAIAIIASKASNNLNQSNFMESIYRKYADLLSKYCLNVGKGDRVFIRSTYLAEPLLQELTDAIVSLGGHPHFDILFDERDRLMLKNAQDHHFQYEDPFFRQVMEEFECYAYIRAPFNTMESTIPMNKAQREMKQQAAKAARTAYAKRTASLEMRRTLCQFPTAAAAQDAGMALSEYADFVFDACNLFDEDPIESWNALRRKQQKIVDHLNGKEEVHYKGSNIDVRFSTKGRTWINSDGKTNMPSGEVYTAPVEDSVNGKVTFTYPSIYFGEMAENVSLEIKDGLVEKWTASRGQELLDK
jgi:aminopeptidase